MNDKYIKLVETLPKESEELWFEYNLEVNKIIQENQQLKADYGTKAQVERDLLLEENQRLKDKIALRNKEKTDICNRIHNQKEKIKRHKAEITNLIAKNQQLKIQISAREEEYKKLEDNWKELKKYTKDNLYFYSGYQGEDLETDIAIQGVLNKMKELEERCMNE